jgi:hypothetical protein
MKFYKFYFISFSLLSTFCVTSSSLSAPASSKMDAPIYAWVMLGDNGQPIVRAATEQKTCPTLIINGLKTPFTQRAEPNMTGQSLPNPALFPERVCESLLPPGAKHIRVAGKTLPLPKPHPKRIVIVGDTGCRLKNTTAQACNDSHSFPYGKIAQRAALWKPDLVIHMGDYHYRETPCPSSVPGCENSPWGYGYDTWKADFFRPSGPLLSAAPWIFVRGNHETCHRAGQGWRRYLSTVPFSAEKTCQKRSPDTIPDLEDSYRIPLGSDAQLIVWDSSYESDGPIPQSDPRFTRYQAIYRQIEELAQRATYSIALSHYPLLGIRPQPLNPTQPIAGALGIQSVFRTLNPSLLPPNIQMLIGGHIHLWEHISFTGDRWPTQLVVGNSGSDLETRIFPHPLPPDMIPYAPTKIDHFSTVEKEYGFTTLERLGPEKWRIQERNTEGRVRRTCLVEQRRSSCQ